MSNQEVLKVDRKTLSELMEGLDSHLYHALKNSIYPGAKDESIAMVIAYCKAKNYDPLQKPVHIVPMSVAVPGEFTIAENGKKYPKKKMRDVIMPGIGAYRIDAHRTGLFMGLDEPVHGKMITEQLGSVTVTYPETSTITGRRWNPIAKQSSVFVGKITWKEFYGRKGGKDEFGRSSQEPNVMWLTMPINQADKCAEAQFLRKTFPEAVGQAPTYEEMEGREIKDVKGVVEILESTSTLDDSHLLTLREKIALAGSKESDICKMMNVDSLEHMKSKDYYAIAKMLDFKSKGKTKPKQQIENTTDDHLSADMALVEE